MLKVGPESAGSNPGPACYGQGGDRPTITDAFAVLNLMGADELGYGERSGDGSEVHRTFEVLRAEFPELAAAAAAAAD